MSKIEWSVPLLQDNGKYFVYATACSTLGYKLRFALEVPSPTSFVGHLREVSGKIPSPEYVAEYTNNEIRFRREMIEERIQRSLDALESGATVYGLTHQEITLLSPEQLEVIDRVWTKTYRAKRSEKLSTQLREKLAASKIRQQAREPSVVMEHDVDDLPWKTW